MSQILAFSGSARKASFNQVLVRLAAQGAEAAGASVQVINLADYEMPLFNEDWERENQGLPEKAIELKQLLLKAKGLLIASPEYNSGMTPLLKNTIDWTSRSEGAGEPPLAAWKDKKAAILAASPGGYGGVRSLQALRTLLEHIDVEVHPRQVTLCRAHEKIDAQGIISDAETAESARKLGETLAHWVGG